MIATLNALKDFFINVVLNLGPFIIIIFTLATLAGLIKWTNKAQDDIKKVSSNPITLLIWIGLAVAGIYFWYKYIPPIFKKQ